MQPNKKEKNEMFKKMYVSSVKASYFNHMSENKFTNKSKLQIQETIKEEEEIDENTFRIETKFVKPDDTVIVYQKKGRFYIEEEGFFSCISSRRRYDVQLANYKLKVERSEGVIDQFFNFETEAVQAVSKGKYFELKVQRCSKTFYFEPVEEHAKDQVVDDWVALLNKTISYFQGKAKHYVYLPIKSPEFYTQEHLSHIEFQQKCNSLDLILFKSQHSAATVQRAFTGSEYDHVGVILRNRKNEIFIFESSSGEGVGLTPWKSVIKFGWYESTDKIAWRKLNMKITEKDVQVIEAYVAKTLGKEFEISLNKLFTFTSVLKRDVEEDKSKTYFCSELVARLYKELGLLDEEKASTQYYPVDFSDKIRLKLHREGAYLEPERLIAFNV